MSADAFSPVKRLYIKENEPLSHHSTIGIGGEAKYFCEVQNDEELKEALLFAKKRNLAFFPLGKGSNTLFDDRGYCGLIIALKSCFFIQEDHLFTVSAGYSFSRLGQKTASLGYTGLEFASGIPGSVGGALFMNAGANGSESADVLKQVRLMDTDGNIHVLNREELLFSYRTSPFQKMKAVITAATFALKPDQNARQRQKKMVLDRKLSQPYEDKSCGCIFRNPKEASAGKLIDSCGLKGTSFGGAEVSSKHANFIVNRKNASSYELKKLLSIVQERVKACTGIDLTPEVRFVSYEGETR